MWRVVRPTNEVDIEAEVCTPEDHGVLSFWTDGEMLYAFASGQWLSAYLHVPGDPLQEDK